MLVVTDQERLGTRSDEQEEAVPGGGEGFLSELSGDLGAHCLRPGCLETHL